MRAFSLRRTLCSAVLLGLLASSPVAAHDPDNSGQLAPLLVPLPVVYPGPGERLVPVEGTEAVQGVEPRLRALFEAWRQADVAAPTFVSASVVQGEITVVLQADALAALPDHVYDLLIMAVSGSLEGHVQGGIHTIRLAGANDAGAPIPDHELRPLIRQQPGNPEIPDTVDDGPSLWLPFHLRWSALLDHRPAGPLSGRRIAVSPGHGLYWTGSGYTTQRSDSFGLIEDYTTSIIAFWHVEPYLRGSGAETIWMRERTRSARPPTIIDDGDSGYSETGTFENGSNPGGYGGDYRFANLDTDSRASYAIPEAAENAPVYVRFLGSGNRSSGVILSVTHRGGETRVPVNQQISGPQWFYIGTFSFDAGQGVAWTTDAETGEVVIADSVLYGTTTGVVVRSGQRTNAPAWREASVHYAEANGAPTTIWQARASDRDSDVVTRPLWANALGVDLYLSIHTNAAGGTGTETYAYNGTPTPGSIAFRDLLHDFVVDDVQAYYNPDWFDRGKKTADFGEIRELDTAPGALVEVAFHDRNPDTGPDVNALKDPRFRRIVGRAMARAIVRYFDPSAPFVPEPPLAVVLQNRDGELVASWEESDGRQASGTADSYRVYVAVGNEAFDAGTQVLGTEFRIGEFDPGTPVSVRVAGVNAGGEGPASTVVSAVSAGNNAAPVLLVTAFDRWDRSTGEEGNTFDYAIRHALAIAQASAPGGARYAADGATSQALGDEVELALYEAVIWQAGEESTADETFSDAQQSQILAFLDAGGRIFASGAEIGWDLQERGSATDRAFLSSAFEVEYAADDAATYSVEPIADATFAGVAPFTFDDGNSGTYNVDFPDIFAAGEGAFVALRYAGTGGAAVMGTRSVLFGFPFETVVDSGTRTALMQGVLRYLTVSGVSDEGEVVESDGDTGPVPEDGFTFDVGPLESADRDEESDAGASDSGGQPTDAAYDVETDSPDGLDPDTGRPRDTGGNGNDSNDDSETARVHDGCGCATAPSGRGGDGSLAAMVLLALTAFRRRRLV